MNKQTNNPDEAEARGAAAAPHWTAGGRAGGWPGPGDRGARSARQGNRRASNPVPAHSDSEARHHAASAPRTHANAHAHTLAHAHHAHGRPDPDSQQGKQGVWPLGAQPRPWPPMRRWDPHREGQEPPRHGPLASSQQREPEGQEAGAGLGSGGPGGLSPPPREWGGRGATTWRLTSSYPEGRWALSRSQASSGLVVYSVTNASFPSYILSTSRIKITFFSGNSSSVGKWLDHICLY